MNPSEKVPALHVEDSYTCPPIGMCVPNYSSLVPKPTHAAPSCLVSLSRIKDSPVPQCRMRLSKVPVHLGFPPETQPAQTLSYLPFHIWAVPVS